MSKIRIKIKYASIFIKKLLFFYFYAKIFFYSKLSYTFVP